MAERVGDGVIGIGAEDETSADISRIQKRLEKALAGAGRKAGERLVRELRKHADTAGDRMVRELQDDFKVIEKQLDELSEGRKIQLQAELEATAARAELLYTARDRIVNLWAVVRGNAAAELQAITKGLSGLSLVESWKDAIVTLGSNLPQTILRVGLLGGAFAQLVNPILNVLTTIAPLGADLGRIFGLLNAAPAYIGAAAAGIGVLVMAFTNLDKASTDAGKQLNSTFKGIKDDFGALQKVVQGNFAAGFAGPFERLASVVMPQLESGLSRVATVLGQQWGAVADQLSTVLSGNALKPFFDNLSAGIQAATPGFADIAEALATIAVKGSDTFERFGEWIAKIGGQFRNWADGADIAAIIERGADALVDLWEVGKQAWRVVAGIFTAMDTGKSTGLESLADTLSRIGDVVNGADFQNTMRTIFTGASEGASALSRALTPIGAALENLAPTISNLLSSLGAGGAAALTGIVEALSAPVATSGLNAAIDAIANMLANIDWGGLSASVGVFGETIAVVATHLTEMVNAIIPHLPPIIEGFRVFSDVAATIAPVIIDMVGSLLGVPGVAASILGVFVGWKAISGIITGINAVIGTYKSVMASAFAVSLLAKTKDLAVTAALSAMYLGDFLRGIVQSGIQMGIQAAKFVATTAAMVAQRTALVAMSVAQKAAAAAQWLLNAAMSANPIGLIVTAIGALVAALVWFFTETELGQEIWANFTKFIGEAWENVSKWLTDALTNLGKFFSDTWTNIQNAIDIAWKVITDIIEGAAKWLVDLFLNWTLLGIIIKHWDDIIAFFQAIPGWIESIFNGAIEWLTRAGIDIILGLYNGVKDFWKNVTDWFNGLPAMIGGFFANVGSWLFNVGKDLIQGLLNGISSLAGTIGNFFLSLLPDWIVGPFKAALGIASPSKLFKTFGKFIGEGLIEGVTGTRAKVEKTMKDLIGQTSKLFDGLREDRKNALQKMEDLERAYDRRRNDHRIKMQRLNDDYGRATTASERRRLARRMDDELKAWDRYNADFKKKYQAQADIVKQTNKALKKGNQKAINDLIRNANKELLRLADKREAYAKKFEEASERLEDAIKVRDDFAASIKSGVQGLFDINALDDKGNASAQSMIDRLRKTIADTKLFQKTIEQLASMGLDDASIQQLTEGFASSGSTAAAEAILAGGQAAVDELSKLQDELAAVGGSLGSSVASELYQAGVDAAQGIVDGLQSKMDAIDALMTEIGESLVKAIKKKLGIKSPSVVLKAVGKNTTEGFIEGAESLKKAAQRSLSTIVQPERLRPATLPSTTFNPNAVRSSTTTNTRTVNIEEGAVQVKGTSASDANKIAQEAADRTAEKVAMAA